MPVQLDKVMSSDMIGCDTVYYALSCIRGTWDRHSEREGGLEPVKIFHLCPTVSMRGLVHVIQLHEMVGLLNKTVSYSVVLMKRSGDGDKC